MPACRSCRSPNSGSSRPRLPYHAVCHKARGGCLYVTLISPVPQHGTINEATGSVGPPPGPPTPPSGACPDPALPPAMTTGDLSQRLLSPQRIEAPGICHACTCTRLMRGACPAAVLRRGGGSACPPGFYTSAALRSRPLVIPWRTECACSRAVEAGRSRRRMLRWPPGAPHAARARQPPPPAAGRAASHRGQAACCAMHACCGSYSAPRSDVADAQLAAAVAGCCLGCLSGPDTVLELAERITAWSQPARLPWWRVCALSAAARQRRAAGMEVVGGRADRAAI